MNNINYDFDNNIVTKLIIARGEKGDPGERGKDGKEGSPGMGITNISQNQDGTLTITLADGSSYDTQPLKGADGHTPVITASKSNGVTTVYVDNVAIATINDGENGQDGAPGVPGAKGDTGSNGQNGYTPVKGVDYWTATDKSEIVSDVEDSIDLSSYVKNTDYATQNDFGILKVGSGLSVSNGVVSQSIASSSEIKTGTESNKSIAPSHQHESAFYGLAKAAGDTTQSQSSNAVGTYTDDAKSAIKTMLGIEDFSDRIAKGTGDYGLITNNILYNTASGVFSHAEGSNVTASGANSHAEGNYNTASGLNSHAEGYNTNASGNMSHAEGQGTIASGRSAHVFGEYNNDLNSGVSSASARGTYVEMVGNGTANTSRSNARMLDWGGNEYLSGGLTLGYGTADQVTMSAIQLGVLLSSSSTSSNVLAINIYEMNSGGTTTYTIGNLDNIKNKIGRFKYYPQYVVLENPMYAGESTVYLPFNTVSGGMINVTRYISVKYNSAYNFVASVLTINCFTNTDDEETWSVSVVDTTYNIPRRSVVTIPSDTTITDSIAANGSYIYTYVLSSTDISNLTGKTYSISASLNSPTNSGLYVSGVTSYKTVNGTTTQSSNAITVNSSGVTELGVNIILSNASNSAISLNGLSGFIEFNLVRGY